MRKYVTLLGKYEYFNLLPKMLTNNKIDRLLLRFFKCVFWFYEE